MKKITLIAVAICCCLLNGYSQNLFNKMKDRVAKKVERGIDKAGDKPGSATEKKSTNNSNEAVTATSEPAAEVKADPAKEKLAAQTRFDFVPGDKLIFWEDFAQEPVGEFPSKWFTRSKGETVTLNNHAGKWMRLYPGGFLSPTVDMKENYTVEFDLIMDFPITGGYLVPSFGIAFYDRGNKMYVFSYDYRMDNHMSISLTPYRNDAYLTLSTRESSGSKFQSEKVKISGFDKKVGQPVHVAEYSKGTGKDVAR